MDAGTLLRTGRTTVLERDEEVFISTNVLRIPDDYTGLLRVAVVVPSHRNPAWERLGSGGVPMRWLPLFLLATGCLNPPKAPLRVQTVNGVDVSWDEYIAEVTPGSDFTIRLEHNGGDDTEVWSAWQPPGWEFAPESNQGVWHVPDDFRGCAAVAMVGARPRSEEPAHGRGHALPGHRRVGGAVLVPATRPLDPRRVGRGARHRLGLLSRQRTVQPTVTAMAG